MNRLKELRLEAKLTLRGLQKYTGVDFSRIAVIEKTDANIENKTLEKFLTFFGVSAEYFFGKDGLIRYYNKDGGYYFEMPYSQYSNVITKDTYTIEIGDNVLRRVVNHRFYSQINDMDDSPITSYDQRIKTKKYLQFLESLSSDDYEKVKEVFNSYFTFRDIKEKLKKH